MLTDTGVPILILTAVLIGVTGYYAYQTRGMVLEMRREYRRAVMLLLVKEMYNPLYDSIQRLWRGAYDFYHCDTGEIDKVINSFWYFFMDEKIKTRIEDWQILLENYNKEMDLIRKPIAETAKRLFAQRLDESLSPDLKKEFKREFEGNLYMLYDGVYLEKLIHGKADDKIIYRFNNFISRPEDKEIKDRVVPGLAKALSDTLRERKVFEKLLPVRDKIIDESGPLLESLHEQFQEFVR